MGPPRRDEPWFTALYERFHPHLVRYGVRRLPDVEAAVELAQDVFVITWRRRAEVPDEPLPWLYGVARRTLANRFRAERARPSVAVPPGDPALTGAVDAGTGVETALDLRAAIARLPEPDREILRLVGWEELSVAEAAQVLGCTRTAAGVRLFRARRRLEAALGRSASSAPQPRPGSPRTGGGSPRTGAEPPRLEAGSPRPCLSIESTGGTP